MILNLEWTDFKNYINAKGLMLQYFENSSSYILLAVENSFFIECKLVKSSPRNADQIDFEDNVKSGSNQKIYDNIRVHDKDSVGIGSIGDRLKVDATITGGSITTLSSKLRYDDMNVSNGGIARGTTLITGANLTTVYSYIGTGNFLGFCLNLESSGGASENWQVNLIIDGEEIFNSRGINTQDFVNANIYNYNTGGSREPSALGMEMVGSSLYFSTSGTYPIRYLTSVTIKVKKTSGPNRKFNAGLVLITKE